ncbi:hypothetical protein Lal_00027282 [Lupinus albus]|nr:hypothetical protein Lal_00027282 [Lupinus albus]
MFSISIDNASYNGSYLKTLKENISCDSRIPSSKLIMSRTEHPQLSRLPAMGLSRQMYTTNKGVSH